jgi:hypothetical protein
MSHGELTCFKLILSALTALVGAMLLEGAFASTFSNVHARASGGGSAAAQAASTRPWWSALASLDSQDLLGLLGGSALVLIFQVRARIPHQGREGGRGHAPTSVCPSRE